MKVTRRQFVRGGVAAFTVSFAAPKFLSELAMAQGASRRNLVVLYLSGGNDALSTLVPYTDPFYYSRRASIAVPAANVLQIGRDSNNRLLGLHPRLTGLKTIFENGHLALIQRTGYPNSSRSHFLGTDIWSTANPANTFGAGWLGRYLDSLPSPVDPLIGWCTQRELPHSLVANHVSVPAIPSVANYAFQSPNNTAAERALSRTAMTKIASHLPAEKPHLSFVNGTTQAALATLDRVALVGQYQPSVAYLGDGLSVALRTVAGAIVQGIGTRVFWVQIGGFDTHATQNTNAANAGYANLMGTINTAVTAFYNDLKNQGLLGDTMVVQFSEFGRRVFENGSAGTDHGAGGLMMAIGGSVRGGLYGTAADLNPFSGNPTLENNGGDVKHETDFRAVYAKIIDNWLGASSGQILGADFTNGPQFI
ncbi:MAG TPA: DUF1501 domain-containing protein [Vicinamibacterales bacterium]|nr:DUF1501 domain-containing protein [Vicinamibacterales bacterium]